ncbi:hypothetical protein LXA43DRAFT_1188196 [Ganoderma leucocontextum]|nr:hypothetical protein LXA43DRAFT_1188196 [Ganoderma leucocontextum]
MGGRSRAKGTPVDRDSAVARSSLRIRRGRRPDETPVVLVWCPFRPELGLRFAERIGLASYYDKPNLRLKAGDLDIFETWARVGRLVREAVWSQAGLDPGVGRALPTLTFWSNHELLDITMDMWGDVCDLIDDMGYGPKYELMWYLDRSLDAP